LKLFLTVVCFALSDFLGRDLGTGQEPEQIFGGSGVKRRQPMQSDHQPQGARGVRRSPVVQRDRVRPGYDPVARHDSQVRSHKLHGEHQPCPTAISGHECVSSLRWHGGRAIGELRCGPTGQRSGFQAPVFRVPPDPRPGIV